MSKASYLIALFGVVFVVGGCPGGDDDDTTGLCEAAEPCEGDYNIDIERDIEAIAQCESISGNLDFDNEDWLTSIDLPCLTSVGGDLIIENNNALTSVDGLSSLTTVGGPLEILDCDALANIDMPALTSMGGDLTIYDNYCLSQAEAEAFAASIDVGDEVSVSDNGANYPCN